MIKINFFQISSIWFTFESDSDMFAHIFKCFVLFFAIEQKITVLTCTAEIFIHTYVIFVIRSLSK